MSPFISFFFSWQTEDGKKYCRLFHIDVTCNWINTAFKANKLNTNTLIWGKNCQPKPFELNESINKNRILHGNIAVIKNKQLILNREWLRCQCKTYSRNIIMVLWGGRFISLRLMFFKSRIQASINNTNTPFVLLVLRWTFKLLSHVLLLLLLVVQ